jgi:hypothetical protein
MMGAMHDGVAIKEHQKPAILHAPIIAKTLGASPLRPPLYIAETLGASPQCPRLLSEHFFPTRLPRNISLEGSIPQAPLRCPGPTLTVTQFANGVPRFIGAGGLGGEGVCSRLGRGAKLKNGELQGLAPEVIYRAGGWVGKPKVAETPHQEGHPFCHRSVILL